MSENRPSIEIIAASIQEAIDQGLVDLGVEENRVEVEILDSGSKGLFGLGTRQARVRLTVLEQAAQTDRPAQAEQGPEEEEEEFAELLAQSEVQAVKKPAGAEPGKIVLPDEEQEEILRTCKEVVEDLLDKMGIQAHVSARMVEPEDDRSKPTIWADVRGNDLSILIGPHAETLNALQYIAGLIASKELDRSVPMVVDVEGFRARRLQQLRQLARRMADQAVKTGRRQLLEPMPASDRRIIHMELRDNSLVRTESTGEEPRRKVTIVPK